MADNITEDVSRLKAVLLSDAADIKSIPAFVVDGIYKVDRSHIAKDTNLTS